MFTDGGRRLRSRGCGEDMEGGECEEGSSPGGGSVEDGIVMLDTSMSSVFSWDDRFFSCRLTAIHTGCRYRPPSTSKTILLFPNATRV